MRKPHSKALLLLFSVIASLVVERAAAMIPEPDVVFVGQAFFVDDTQVTAADTGITVGLKVNGVVIASYTMGDTAAAQDQYVLKVPMDVLGSRPPGAARFNDRATIFAVSSRGETTLVSVDIGQRGTITALDLLGVPIPDGPDPGDTLDTDGDGIVDSLDLDDDNDGISDIAELDLGRNPLLNEGAVMAIIFSILSDDEAAPPAD